MAQLKLPAVFYMQTYLVWWHNKYKTLNSLKTLLRGCEGKTCCGNIVYFCWVQSERMHISTEVFPSSFIDSLYMLYAHCIGSLLIPINSMSVRRIYY